MGKLRVYCLKTLKKLSIYPLGNTPSAPSDGAPDFLSRHSLPLAHKWWAILPVESTGKALSRLRFTSLTSVLVVGGLGIDAWQLVSPLDSWGDARWPALAPGSSNGSCPWITSWFRTRSKRCDDVDVAASRCHWCQCHWQTMGWVHLIHEVLGCARREALGSSSWGED